MHTTNTCRSIYIILFYINLDLLNPLDPPAAILNLNPLPLPPPPWIRHCRLYNTGRPPCGSPVPRNHRCSLVGNPRVTKPFHYVWSAERRPGQPVSPPHPPRPPPPPVTLPVGRGQVQARGNSRPSGSWHPGLTREVTRQIAVSSLTESCRLINLPNRLFIIRAQNTGRSAQIGPPCNRPARFIGCNKPDYIVTDAIGDCSFLIDA